MSQAQQAPRITLAAAVAAATGCGLAATWPEAGAGSTFLTVPSSQLWFTCTAAVALAVPNPMPPILTIQAC
jgi:hypothetical protein